MKKYFGVILFYVTVIPFLIALSNLVEFHKFYALEQAIVFLALIHVPMTVYLFFDPAIRSQIRREPLKFIAVPVCIFAICLTVFLWNTPAIMAQKADTVTYFMLAALFWNFWHFGKQNLGVYAYYRLSTSAGGMLPVERKLIYCGAFLGAVSASFLGLQYYGAFQFAYARNVYFDNWNFLSGYFGVFGEYFQYAIAAFTVAHILRQRSRFNLKSGLLFFLCVNYFLPAYIGLSSEKWIQFYISSSYSHGAQYMVFLFFHSYNTRHSTQAKQRSTTFISLYAYTIIFFLLILVIGDIYSWHKVVPNFHFADKTSDAYWTSLVAALSAGILLCHFWFDSFFWKFKNKDAREWMLQRYDFLFNPTTAKAQAPT